VVTERILSESIVEQAALSWFDELGYFAHAGYDVSPNGEMPLRDDYEDPILTARLRSALRRINEHLPEDSIEYAMRVVTRPPEPTLEQNNRWFHSLLTDGIEVEYRTADGDIRGDRVRLLDFQNPARNEFLGAC
jgi:type I restriction enzyme, R subunit